MPGGRRMEGQGGWPSPDPLQPPRPWAAEGAEARVPAVFHPGLGPSTRALSGTHPSPRSHSRFTLQRQPNPTDLELSTVTPGRHIQPAEERRQPQGRALGTGPASACRTTLTHSPASANVAAEMGRSQATGQGHRKSLGRQREHLGAGRAVSSGQPREIVRQRPVELGREQPH